MMLHPIAGEPRWMLARDGWWWFVYHCAEYTTEWKYVDDALFLFKFNARRFIKRKTAAEYYDKWGKRTW